MRCVGCNECLTDSERRKKNKVTEEYDDLCRVCRSHIYSGIGFDQNGDMVILEAGADFDKEYVGGERGGSEGAMSAIIAQKGYLQMD